MSKGRIIGASIGECVHTAGILGFLRLAAKLGYKTEFLGAAMPVKKFIDAVVEYRPDIAAISYRLTPQVAEALFDELKKEICNYQLTDIRFLFGGTPPVAEIAAQSGIFDQVFSGKESQQTVIDLLEQQSSITTAKNIARTLVERIKQMEPAPLLRHHLGLETVEKTAQHARTIALSEELDILSLAPDQNAQQYFFRPQEMQPHRHGAGGVPVRTSQDMRTIYEAAQCGNFPLLRCYSGTEDLLQWAAMSVETINNAWGAIPLFWYSDLDRRSARPLAEAIRENQQAIRWYGKEEIPVEINEAHQWSLRDGHDALAVAIAYLAAYNARALGVKKYVAQYMLNTPPDISPAMDLAKMLAKIELIESLHNNQFTSFREIRTGLRGLMPDPDRARGYLAASLTIGMALRPHIIHVVGYCEAEHAATADVIIESCRITRGATELALSGLVNVQADPAIIDRKQQLVEEAQLIIDAIRSLGVKNTIDPLIDPHILTEAVQRGILDAPQLRGFSVARGQIMTTSVNGCYVAVDAATGKPMTENERLGKLQL